LPDSPSTAQPRKPVAPTGSNAGRRSGNNADYPKWQYRESGVTSSVLVSTNEILRRIADGRMLRTVEVWTKGADKWRPASNYVALSAEPTSKVVSAQAAKPGVVASHDEGQSQDASVVPAQVPTIPNTLSGADEGAAGTKSPMTPTSSSQPTSPVSYQKVGTWTIVWAIASFLFSVFWPSLESHMLGTGSIVVGAGGVGIAFLVFAPFAGLGIAILQANPHVARTLTWVAVLWYFVVVLLAAATSGASDSAASGFLYASCVLMFLLRTRHSNGDLATSLVSWNDMYQLLSKNNGQIESALYVSSSYTVPVKYVMRTTDEKTIEVKVFDKNMVEVNKELWEKEEAGRHSVELLEEVRELLKESWR